jgi:hypothetical protein
MCYDFIPRRFKLVTWAHSLAASRIRGFLFQVCVCSVCFRIMLASSSRVNSNAANTLWDKSNQLPLLIVLETEVLLLDGE